nr:hypothetical protein [Oceanococcus sp. HetDA_MAG_MS8]
MVIKRAIATALLCSTLLACGQGGRDGLSSRDAATPSQPHADGASRAEDGFLAGVASVDASWHLGASAGQFAATGVGIDNARGFDPYMHSIRKVGSDILGSRIFTRALVMQGNNGKRVAIVANDLYLPNDLLRRRTAQILAQGDTGIAIDNLAITVSHSHTSPFYSTPSWGTWIFQDVYDLRFYEYMAQRMAEAVTQAVAQLRPAQVGGTAFYANDVRGHTYGPKVSPLDNTPAGQPRNYTTRQAYVMTFQDPASGEPIANWITLGVHPEWVWGEEIMNGDLTHAIMRVLDRETGAMTIMSQSETGTSGPHKDQRAHPGSSRREFQESNLAGADHAARLFADRVHTALASIESGQPWDPTQFMPLQQDIPVDFFHQRFAPPTIRPYPGLSNCNTDQLYQRGNVGVPVAGFPDCERPAEPLIEAFEANSPVAPGDLTGPLTDQLLALGVPLPTSYSATALTAVEEQATVPIQAFRVGNTALAFCPCEQFTDPALNLISRLNQVEGDLHTGWDWHQGYPEDLRKPTEVDYSDSVGCIPEGDGWSCPHPSRFNDSRLHMSDLAFRRMQAQIHNDANGWEDLQNLLHAESEPVEPTEIWGNFTHEELTEFGYELVIPVGMANDYWGYMPAYREYRSHDHYRKALAGLGPHGADFLNNRLARGAASLKGHPGPAAGPLDTLYLAESARAEALALGLGLAAQAVVPVYEATLPNDGGNPQIVEQPKDVPRFAAASLRFVGGSNYTDMPTVEVQRLINGVWTTVGDQTGEVQLHLDFLGATEVFAPDDSVSVPNPDDLAAWRLGQFIWEWTATYEAFASDIPLVEAHQVGQGRPQQSYVTPAGRYRFVVQGEHKGTGNYNLVSDSFAVLNAAHMPIDELQLNGQQLSARLGVSLMSEFKRGAGTDDTIETSLRSFGPIDYNDVAESPIPWARPGKNIHTYAEGDDDDEFYCHRCSFRPWRDTGDWERICASLVRANGEREQACLDNIALDQGQASFRFRQVPQSGDKVGFAQGDLRDTLGQINHNEAWLDIP